MSGKEDEPPVNFLDHLELSQRSQDEIDSVTNYCVVVTRTDNGDELLHIFCSYHPQAGPVRPDSVSNLQVVEGKHPEITWEWSENSFDVASPGAYFKRPLTVDGAGRLAWAGPVVRTAKEKSRPKPPTTTTTSVRQLLLKDLVLKDECWTEGMSEDRVKIVVSYGGKTIDWIGTSGAESQSITLLKATAVEAGKMARIDFNYYTAENGSKHASDMSLFVQLGADGIEWVK